MKESLVIIIFCAITTNLFSQREQIYGMEERNSVTVGILQGGGSLIGADFELLLTDQFGFQVGAGLVGFGGGLTYHFEPSIRSSFMSLVYWNQGIGNSFAQNAIGTTYVFRGKKWFTCQLGLGVPLEKGPAMPMDYELPPVMLLYSIGVYIPFY
jgi:hypothetical protein